MRHTMRRPHDRTHMDASGIRRLDGTVAACYRGVYRWSRILTGRVAIRNFRADQVEGADWYKRAMRAHANCVENPPVFGAIVFGLYVGNVSGALVNALAVAVLVARIMQSLVHLCLLRRTR